MSATTETQLFGYFYIDLADIHNVQHTELATRRCSTRCVNGSFKCVERNNTPNRNRTPGLEGNEGQWPKLVCSERDRSYEVFNT
jgi:hypothetical protein